MHFQPQGPASEKDLNHLKVRRLNDSSMEAEQSDMGQEWDINKSLGKSSVFMFSYSCPMCRLGQSDSHANLRKDMKISQNGASSAISPSTRHELLISGWPFSHLYSREMHWGQLLNRI